MKIKIQLFATNDLEIYFLKTDQPTTANRIMASITLLITCWQRLHAVQFHHAKTMFIFTWNHNVTEAWWWWTVWREHFHYITWKTFWWMYRTNTFINFTLSTRIIVNHFTDILLWKLLFWEIVLHHSIFTGVIRIDKTLSLTLQPWYFVVHSVLNESMKSGAKFTLQRVCVTFHLLFLR